MLWFIGFGKHERVDNMHYESTIRDVLIRKYSKGNEKDFGQQSISHVAILVLFMSHIFLIQKALVVYFWSAQWQR